MSWRSIGLEGEGEEESEICSQNIGFGGVGTLSMDLLLVLRRVPST